MKAIEKNDSGDMSAQGPAPIYLHKCRGSDGEIQSEDVQKGQRKSTESVAAALLARMNTVSEPSLRTQTPLFKTKGSKTISHHRA